MPETKFGPLESLVGRTFERNGKRRKVLEAHESKDFIPGNEACVLDPIAPGGGSLWWTSSKLQRWLSGAKEVKP